jgi:hypothetical protein
MVTIDSETGEITCFAGTGFALNFYFWTDAANTVAKDMTGAIIRFTAKKQLDNDPTDAKAVIRIDTTLTAPSPVNLGTITFSDDATITGTNIVPGQYYYDVKVHPASGDDYVAYHGKFTVEQSVGKR